ncbi:MAG: thioredoxin family protein [Saprospiraceae bacterium]|nr:thioredoxin family protein [Saprospiraceae bacterium]
MALTESNMLPLGTKAPSFLLTDTVSLRSLSLEEAIGETGTVIMFICNHCPYVIHVNPELIRIANEYTKKGIGFVAISSNDVNNYPDDGPDQMQAVANQLQYPFPYLYDETQEVAKAYDAACTPDIYVFDEHQELVYRGRLDDSRPGNEKPLTGKDLRLALDMMLNGSGPIEKQYPGSGCNIKWKK